MSKRQTGGARQEVAKLPARRGPGQPFEPGNEAAVKSGAEGALIVAPRAAELVAELRVLVPSGCDSDLPAITLLAWQLARIERANAYLAEVGLLDADGVPQPVLRVLSTFENSAARLMDQLGLTPTARARLGLDVVRARGEAARQHIEERYGGNG